MNRRIKSIVCSVGYSPIGDKMVRLTGLDKLWRWMHIRSVKKSYYKEALKEFEKGTALGTLSDYKDALERHWVSYREYAYQYEFYKKTEEERDEYVSRLRMGYFYWKYTPSAAKVLLRKKRSFEVLKKYMRRQWLYVPNVTFEEFEKMTRRFDCIAKPSDGKLGRGISKIYKDRDVKDDKRLYEKCKRDSILLEECIEACEELKALHPLSLNTIRVVTVAGRDKVSVLSGVLRTGRGDSVVDNSHAGGISAQINVNNGIVESLGADTTGQQYEYHPDSGIKFVGFQIPHWEDVVATCCEAALVIGSPMIGWDVAVNNRGEVEIVEGNYGPDMDMMQTRYKVGAKKKIYGLIKENCGIDVK